MSKYTIIIPTYKRNHDLKKALYSVLNQTFRNIEIIVINDCISNIGPEKIIDEINDQRIKYFTNEGAKGANGARNTGIRYSTGEYLAFLDDDDEYCSTRIQEVDKILSNKEYDGCITGFNYSCNKKVYKSKNINKSINIENYLKHKIKIGSSSNLLIRKPLNVEMVLWNEDLLRFQDIHYMIKLLYQGFTMAYLPHRLLTVNGHECYLSAKEQLIEKKKLFNTIDVYFKNIDMDVRRYFISRHLRSLALEYGREGDMATMYLFLKKSLKMKILSPEKYVKFILIVVKKIWNIDILTLWENVKHQLLGK